MVTTSRISPTSQKKCTYLYLQGIQEIQNQTEVGVRQSDDKLGEPELGIHIHPASVIPATALVALGAVQEEPPSTMEAAEKSKAQERIRNLTMVIICSGSKRNIFFFETKYMGDTDL